MVKIFRSRVGFTLVELIIVTIIVGILAAVAIPFFKGNIVKSRQSEAIMAIGTIRTALRMYYNEHKSYPEVAYFTDESNALSSYVKSADLDGVYYSAACYSVYPLGLENYEIVVFPYRSSAPKAADIIDTGTIVMSGDGTIYINPESS